MNGKTVCDVAHTLPVSMTEGEYARYLSRQGAKTVQHRGRIWREAVFGFWIPVHWLGSMPPEGATRPSALCWGFRAPLESGAAPKANATIPVHLVSDVRGYDLSSLHPKRRSKIKRFLEQVEVVQILKPDLLLREGYDVLLSSQLRTRYGRVPTRSQYERSILSLFETDALMILGGLIDGKLGGYTINFAIEDTAYSHQGFFATEALKANISSGLDYVMMQIYRRSGIVSQVSIGLETPENESLTRFKEEMGFHVVHLPARVWFGPGMESVVRALRPRAYFRLTGHARSAEADPQTNRSLRIGGPE